MTDQIRPATAADVDAFTALASAKRRQYAGYQPVFWAPGVYNPGGRTGQIDDFVVEPGRWNSSGIQLLRAAVEQAKDRGAIRVVVVAGHLDQEKREALQASGLSIASEWWVTPALTEACG
jgi:GNAT superfamily N-acetyltransferase